MANDVTFERLEYTAHKHQWELCLKIYNGIDTAKFLIVKNPNEYTEDFNNRVERATLENFIERISNTMSGEIFRKPITFENTSEATLEELKTVGQGHITLDQFAKDLTQSAILSGKSFLLVDAPTAGGSVYFSIIERSQVINWKQDPSTGLYTQIVIKEVYFQDVGKFEVEQKVQYRVIDEVGNVEIYREAQNSNVYELFEEINTSYNFCPVFELLIEETPPLYDIATINKNHLNFSSSQDDYLLEALTPMLFGKSLGISTEDSILSEDKPNIAKMVVGVRSANFSDDPNSSLEWIEMSGQTYDISSKNLEKKEKQMAERALKLQSESTSNVTATESLQSNTEKQSRLTDISQDVQNTLTQALNAWQQIKNSTDFKGSLTINKDFNISSMDNSLLSGLTGLQISGNLSRETLLKSLVKHEVIDLESVDEEIDRIELEALNVEGLEEPKEPEDKS